MNFLGESEKHPGKWASQMALVVKNLPANAGDGRETGSIPGLRRLSGGGYGNPLQYTCLENPMDRAWQATVHEVAKSQTRLRDLAHTHSWNTSSISLDKLRLLLYN